MANKTLVMCTSTGSLDYTGDTYKNLNIDIIRLHVYFKDNDYLEGYNLDPVKFYQDLEALDAE